MSETTLGTQPKTPNNRAGYLFPEALVRQFLAYQFDQIQRTVDDPSVTFIEELFHKFGDATAREVKTWWRNHKVPVHMGYTRADTTLPFVTVVNGGEQEKDNEAVLGDYGGQASYGSRDIALLGGGIQRVAQHTRQVLTTSLQHSTRIFVAAGDPNVATYIYHVIWALLMLNKIDFDRYGGMRSLSIAGGDIEHHPELFPEFAYFKVITLSYSSQFDVPQAKQQTSGGVSITLGAFLADVGSVAVDLKAGE
jgi:hypothetical protein